MRNMAVLHSPAFSYPLPVLVRVLSNLLIFKGKILYYNKDTNYILSVMTGSSYNFCLWVIGINDVQGVWKSFTFANKRKNKVCKRTL